jgi:hypothetical protein
MRCGVTSTSMPCAWTSRSALDDHRPGRGDQVALALVGGDLGLQLEIVEPPTTAPSVTENLLVLALEGSHPCW